MSFFRDKVVLVTGFDGQVGSNFIDILSSTSEKDKCKKIISPSLEEMDFSSPQIVKNYLASLPEKPDLIFNTAAYTAVDAAEDEKELCNNINNESVKIIADFCSKNSVKLVHYSTDYVYNGLGEEPFKEDESSRLGPQNYYGETKLLADQSIAESGCEYLIFRTSWVYNHVGKNFVITMINLLKEKEELRVINDQIGSLTYAKDIAELSIACLEKTVEMEKFPSGIYHLSGKGYGSWFDFVKMIREHLYAKKASVNTININAIKTEEFPTKAKRPHNSRLSHEKIIKVFGVEMPKIENSLKQCLDKIIVN